MSGRDAPTRKQQAAMRCAWISAAAPRGRAEGGARASPQGNEKLASDSDANNTFFFSFFAHRLRPSYPHTHARVIK